MDVEMNVLSRVRRRLGLSKNKKKSWRKHIDINDVEEFLEEKRYDERIGGPVSEKPDEKLFFVDKEKEEKPVTIRKKEKQLRSLKCHQSLLSTSAVLPPIKINQHTISQKKRKKKLSKIYERRELKKLEHLKSKLMTKNENNALYDIWGKGKEELENTDIDRELLQYQLEMTKQRPVNIPKHRFQKPSLLPAIELPHAGASYNPTFEDHQDLLRTAHEIELKKTKEENKTERSIAWKNIICPFQTKEEMWLTEMSQGLNEKDEDGEKVRVEVDESEKKIVGNPPVRSDERKPRAKRRRQIEQKRKEREAKLRKLERKRLNEIYKLRNIKSEIKAEEEISLQKQRQRAEREIEKMYQPHTLSKHKYEAPDIELKLSNELSDSLRSLKAEGNVLEDRYKSLQRRNLIETRIPQKRKRKYKLKVFVRKSHRDDDIVSRQKIKKN